MGTGDLPGRTKRRSDQGHRSATTPAPAPSDAVCFGAIASSGKGSIVALAEVPQWFDGGARTHDASADITSTLLHLPLRHLTRILADDPGRWRQMGRLLVRKLRIALSPLEDMALEPPRVRLARCLINLFEGYVWPAKDRAVMLRARVATVPGNDALAQSPDESRAAGRLRPARDDSRRRGRTSSWQLQGSPSLHRAS
jgi:hypothetical protein